MAARVTERIDSTRLQTKRDPALTFDQIWIVEDDAQTSARQGIAGVLRQRRTVVVQLHEVVKGESQVIASCSYQAGELRTRVPQTGRTGLALQMLDIARARSGLVVAGTSYGTNRDFIPGVLARHMDIAVEVPRDTRWITARGVTSRSRERADQLLRNAKWSSVRVVNPETGRPTEFQVAELGTVVVHQDSLRAFGFAPGSVIDPRGDLRIALTSVLAGPIEEIIQCIGWARWIRALNRRRARPNGHASNSAAPTTSLPRTRIVGLNSRPNIRLARQQDLRFVPIDDSADRKRAVVRERTRSLRVMELFAGAGGLGLGFVLAGGIERYYELLYSAEVEPIYVQTLRRNHEFRQQQLSYRQVPDVLAPLDLRRRWSEEFLSDLGKAAGGIDVLIGGPPCQGFSNANRNSWSAMNPNNRLVDVFLRYVRKLQPRLALIENVQGIMWTGQADSAPSVADHVARSLRRSGYLAFPKLLDAVWFGVPQHRTRFFLLAVHQDAGYKLDDFGPWGPFPRPTHGPGTDRDYVTVGDAIGDLPRIGNGFAGEAVPYAEPSAELISRNPFLAAMRNGAEKEAITDHVTSRHAPYVIDRYRRIRQGGNWQAISDMMTNYTSLDRTHSNIYRRLRKNEPAITIGHYRKSMLVHPTQHRGLSLREAARLQSFPDWFRFAGTADGGPGGLMYKQQQLANAVCPLLAKAIADFLLAL